MTMKLVTRWQNVLIIMVLITTNAYLNLQQKNSYVTIQYIAKDFDTHCNAMLPEMTCHDTDDTSRLSQCSFGYLGAIN